MLYKFDRTGRIETTYKCDKCKKIVLKSQIKGIGITNDKQHMIRRWDLCLNCYDRFEKAMLKGLKNER